jgi:hypothetical protein
MLYAGSFSKNICQKVLYINPAYINHAYINPAKDEAPAQLQKQQQEKRRESRLRRSAYSKLSERIILVNNQNTSPTIKKSI